MNYSTIVRDGSARDEALKRRNAAARETLGMAPKPEREKEPAETKVEEKSGT